MQYAKLHQTKPAQRKGHHCWEHRDVSMMCRPLSAASANDNGRPRARVILHPRRRVACQVPRSALGVWGEWSQMEIVSVILRSTLRPKYVGGILVRWRQGFLRALWIFQEAQQFIINIEIRVSSLGQKTVPCSCRNKNSSGGLQSAFWVSYDKIHPGKLSIKKIERKTVSEIDCRSLHQFRCYGMGLCSNNSSNNSSLILVSEMIIISWIYFARM